MVSTAKAIDDIRVWFEANETGWPVFRWHPGGDEEARLFNEVAGQIALGYSEARYSYDFAGFVANTLWVNYIRVCQTPLEIPEPDLMRRVYEAFDAGDMPSPTLPPHDPIKTFTDPMIAEIVAAL